MDLHFFEGDGDVFAIYFGDFVVGVVGVFGEIVGEGFGGDEIGEALR